MRSLIPPALAGPALLGAALLTAAPTLAGPPWISIELPANPHDPATRGALLVVRAYHHATGAQYQVTGTAEGLVDGDRRSIALTVAPTKQAGVYAVARPSLAEGRWVLVLTLQHGGRPGATALVSLSGDDVRGVRVPSRVNGEGWTIPRPVSAEEVDAILLQDGLAAVEAGYGAGHQLPLLALGGLLGLLVAPMARRRRGLSTV